MGCDFEVSLDDLSKGDIVTSPKVHGSYVPTLLVLLFDRLLRDRNSDLNRVGLIRVRGVTALIPRKCIALDRIGPLVGGADPFRLRAPLIICCARNERMCAWIGCPVIPE